MVKGKHTEKLQVGRQEVVDARNCFALRWINKKLGQ